ncbi:molybdopterin-dependent oxidoreductase [Phenylobacterium sp.]|uniref:molybdopterin-dependent oxidoreductase n=1 Tax=Phenylobacterium sp. TaxID=1871053 RepID=UPI002E33FF99|nr:molybdopterin-dependent oxidoreductase [Phenylobacterium sp.]HEX2561635.1 molybdopterin-dependent oxidoreductase [Phenylobacterium sp.]
MEAGRLTTCPYCGVGCGIAAQPGEARALTLKGDAAHPANFGRLCSKGAALASTVSLQGRLLHPMIGEARTSWVAATRLMADTFARTIAEHGPDSVAFYVSGQLLTEDYYAANKLMKGFIGSGNIDTNSRLCMASAVAAHKQAFGADLVPGCYEDLDLADLVVFSGHNAAWTHPVLFRRLEQARGRGQSWIVIDPRRTDTAEGADLFLPIAPQTDVRLWNGLLAYLDAHGHVDRAYVDAHVAGLAETLAALAADDQSLSAVAADCGLPEKAVVDFYRAFAATPRAVTLFSMGSNQSAQGVAKALAVINAHLASGKIGKPGAAPFSITGQPNAMGGRETGGMATTLAAHMDFSPEERDRVARFWNAPRIAERPGLKAVEMFEKVRSGQVKALWVMATNPAVSLPDASKVREALAACPFVVVSDCVARTDTSAFAHVRLPALGWSEKDGTVTNSERRISRQRSLFPAPGEARADWRIVADVAQAMGFSDAFAWTSQADVFREYAQLTAFENAGRRCLDLGPLADLTEAEYEAMAPVQWPVKPEGGTDRLFTDGCFQTPEGRARMIPVAAKGPASAVTPDFPFALNTGRVRDHWHTMTRTGLAPELCRHTPEPMLEVHPADGAAAGLTDGELALVETPVGRAVVTARFTDRQRRGGLFLPMHWTDAFAPSGKANPLIEARVDPTSGQPEFKHTPARVAPYREAWRGFFVAREPWTAPAGFDLVWRRTPYDGCHVHEFAGRGQEAERQGVMQALLAGAAGEVLAMDDPARGAMRRALVLGGRPERVLVITRMGALPARGWIADRFLDDALALTDRIALLAGRAADAVDPGRIVCACFRVGERAIAAAASGGALTLDAVGEATGAGTNCGSCRPEIARLLKETVHAHAA